MCDQIGRSEISSAFATSAGPCESNGASNFQRGAKFSGDVASRSLWSGGLEITRVSVLVVMPADAPFVETISTSGLM